MAERVMMAFWGKVPQCDLQQVTKGECASDDEWKCFCRRKMLENARAAIAAMREPTEAMHRAAGYEFQYGEGLLSDGDTTNNVWHLMIDEALKP